MHRPIYTTIHLLVDQQQLKINQSTLSSHINNHLDNRMNKKAKKYLGSQVYSSRKAPSKCWSAHQCNTEPDIVILLVSITSHFFKQLI